MTIDEVNAQFDDLQAAVATAETNITAYIKTLKDQIAAGIPITQAQLDALGAGLTGLAKGVRDFDINTTTPPVVPPVEPAPQPVRGR